MRYSIDKTTNLSTQVRDRRMITAKIVQRLALLLVIASVVMSVYYFRADIAAWYADIRLRQQVVEEEKPISYSRISFEPDSDNVYALFGSDLAVINKGNYKLYSPDGEELFALQLGYSRPALAMSEVFTVAYNRGGTNLTVTDKTSQIKTITVSGPIVSAEMNRDGVLAVAHGDEMYRGIVSVYDARQGLIYQWKTSDYYVFRAAVSPDGKNIAVTAYTQNGGIFISRIFFFDLTREQYRATADLEGTVVTNTYYLSDDRVCLVGDRQAVIMDIDGNVMYNYDYGNNMLKLWTSGGGYVVLTLLDRTSGLGAILVTLSADSDRPREMKTVDEIRRMDARGDYIAVLYSQSVQLFDKGLKAVSRDVDVFQTRNILVSPEGLVLLIYSSDAGYVDLLATMK